MLKTWALDKLPKEPKTHVVNWGSGKSEPMSVQRAHHLASVGNKRFKRRTHTVERLEMPFKVETGVRAGMIDTAIKVMKTALCGNV